MDIRAAISIVEKAMRPAPETPEFKLWFGDSKIVDEDGKPLVLYHGTPSTGIHAFEVGYNSWGNKDFSGNHKVISFSTDPGFADRYAGTPTHGRNPTVYPVYIRSVNPGDFRNPEHVEAVKRYYRKRRETWLEGAKAQYPDIWTPDHVEEFLARENRHDAWLISHGAWQKWENPDLWQAMGWDGAWAREEPEHVHSSVLNFAVANGRQVKSAIGNKGTFDPDSPKLTEAADRRRLPEPNNSEFIVFLVDANCVSVHKSR